jgi:gliding motility-associated-like protein
VTIYVINELFIPNAFSPDGDNINDVWKIPGMALYPEAVVTIYNRYGQKIFETKNYYAHPWDGTHKGIIQAHGSFVYFISLNDSKKQQLKGFVSIIR